MKYKVGDKVKVRKDIFFDGKYLQNFLGKIVTIERVLNNCYLIEEDESNYNWLEVMFEGLAEYTYEDFKKAPIGTKIWEDTDMYIKVDEKFVLNYDGGFEVLEEDMEDISKIEEPSYTTVYEAKKDILDEKEREYLSNVIKPFKDKVEYISKYKYYDEVNEFLVIAVKEKNKCLEFPDFPANIMYKGMEADREYSLKELGLN